MFMDFIFNCPISFVWWSDGTRIYCEMNHWNLLNTGLMLTVMNTFDLPSYFCLEVVPNSKWISPSQKPSLSSVVCFLILKLCFSFIERLPSTFSRCSNMQTCICECGVCMFIDGRCFFLPCALWGQTGNTEGTMHLLVCTQPEISSKQTVKHIHIQSKCL